MLKRTSTQLIFFASLSVRIVAWWWVTTNDTPLFADEAAYFDLARAWEAFLHALFNGSLPNVDVRDAAYGYGSWPPLHPFLLALGSVFGELDGARFIPVLLSSCTTLVILKLALQCGLSFRNASVAALFHALYPECIAFSHYLWSETAFSFFLLLGLVFALAASEAGQSGRRSMAHALAAGGLLGCAGLCRTTVLPALFFLSLWWIGPALKPFWRNRDKRLLYPHLLRSVFLFGMFFLVVAPWLITLRLHEGEWKPFSTSWGYNFYTGNHWATPRGLGSTWGTFTYQGGGADQISARIKQEAGSHAVDYGLWLFAQDKACRAAAWQEIHTRPLAAVRRVFLRGGTLFAPDIFLPRHILNLIYRPMPVIFAGFLLLLNVAAWATVLLGVSLALWRVHLAPRLWLLALMAVLMAAPALVTISMSRMRFASTLLLLPVACEGLLSLGLPGRYFTSRIRKAGAAFLLTASLALCFFFLPLTLEHFTAPSNHYGSLVHACSRIGLIAPVTVDTLLIRREACSPRTIELDLTAVPDTSLIGKPESRKVLIDLSQPQQPCRMVLRAKAGEPIRLTWRAAGGHQTATTVFSPGSFSCAWRPTGLPEVSVSIQGSNYHKDIWR